MANDIAENKMTVVALVENEPGVLNRIASLFRRRAFNIDSLTVGRTHKPHISRMTIRVVARSRICQENRQQLAETGQCYRCARARQ